MLKKNQIGRYEQRRVLTVCCVKRWGECLLCIFQKKAWRTSERVIEFYFT